MNQSWKDAWWVVYAHANASCFRLQMYFRHNQFWTSLPPCSSAQRSLTSLAAAAEEARSCQQLLTGFAACSWVPELSPNSAAGMWGHRGRFLGALCLSFQGISIDFWSDLKLYLVVHDHRSSSFLKGMLGQEFWSLTACLIFCKLYFDKH